MNKIKILFLAANPRSVPHLSLGEELRDILEKIRATARRDAFDVVFAPAARPDDLEQALLQHEPVIVHFSGHGSGQKGLMFQQHATDEAALVSTEALGHLFKLLRNKVRIVILNACYSKPQAIAIADQIDFVVGMKDSISDIAARKFVASFYRGLGFEQTISTAFGLGISALKREGLIDDEDIPELFTRTGISADMALLGPPRARLV